MSLPPGTRIPAAGKKHFHKLHGKLAAGVCPSCGGYLHPRDVATGRECARCRRLSARKAWAHMGG